MRKLLVLQDHSESQADLILSLQVLGYEVVALEISRPSPFRGVELFDVVLWVTAATDSAGLRKLGELRSMTYYPPVVAITSAQDRSQVAELLECGCDCVLAGLPNLLELKAWIESLVRRRDMYRRAEDRAESLIRLGDLEIDILARMVRTRARSSELTEREMKLLVELARRPGEVCRRADLLEKVWGSASESLTGTLNTHINRLRMKIEDDFKTPQRLIGVYGVGYRLNAVQQSTAADVPGRAEKTVVETEPPTHSEEIKTNH